MCAKFNGIQLDAVLRRDSAREQDDCDRDDRDQPAEGDPLDFENETRQHEAHRRVQRTQRGPREFLNAVQSPDRATRRKGSSSKAGLSRERPRAARCEIRWTLGGVLESFKGLRETLRAQVLLEQRVSTTPAKPNSESPKRVATAATPREGPREGRRQSDHHACRMCTHISHRPDKSSYRKAALQHSPTCKREFSTRLVRDVPDSINERERSRSHDRREKIKFFWRCHRAVSASHGEVARTCNIYIAWCIFFPVSLILCAQWVVRDTLRAREGQHGREKASTRETTTRA